MKASILSLGAVVTAASALTLSNDTMVTSTILTTELYTITSCAPTVTNCPVGAVTSTVKTTTTVCPITATYPPAPPTTPVTKPVTSTFYSTNVYTITACPPTVTNCPVGSKTSSVITSTIVCTDATKCGSYTLPPPVSTGPVTKPTSAITLPPPVSTGPATKPTTAITLPPPVSSVPYCPSAVTSYITVTAYPSSSVKISTNTVPAVPATTPYVCPGSPNCPATTPVTKPATTAYGTGSSTGAKTYATSTPVPFISGASAQKAGGFMVALGAVVAALL